jgi:hypothetical protein
MNEQNLPGLLACMVMPDVTCTAAHTKSNTGLQKEKRELMMHHHHYYTFTQY